MLCASSITYVESLVGEHFTYAQAMGSVVALVLLGGAIVFTLGLENKGVSFGKSAPASEKEQYVPACS